MTPTDSKLFAVTSADIFNAKLVAYEEQIVNNATGYKSVDIEVYPNPVSNTLVIAANKLKSAQVYDTAGSCLLPPIRIGLMSIA